MADTTLKFKRGQESKVNSLAKEDGSVIFGLGSSGAPSTLHFDSTNGSSVQRLGVAVASASSANTASTATKLRTARKINDASFDGTKDVDITELHPVVITDQSVDLNTLRLTGDFLGRKLYLCGTDGGSANITHKPETGNEGFALLVEQLRYTAPTDYVNKQTLEYRTSHKVYVRYSNGANWGSWVLQSDDGIASTANYSKNSGALGGSSLSQVLASAGGGSAFVGLDTTTNNVVKLTRANGGTVQKTINNVSHATSASIATSANIAKALPATVTLGSGNGAIIDQNGSNYRQRIRIEDNGSANDNVFVFQQSANAGSTYTDLFRILDNGTVVANTFTGALNGTANYAKNAAALGGSSLSQILASAGGGKYVPISGGTMTGTLGFANNTGIVGTMASSDQWRIIGGGSSDSGYLEIATRDNANEPIYVRQYTSFSSTGLKRTATLLDSNGNTSFPGQVSASTLTSSVIKGPGEVTYQMYSPNLYQVIDLTSSTYSTAIWYPIVGSGLNYYGYTHIKCAVQLNSGSKPNWSTHAAGFTCNLDVLVKAGGWGTTDGSDIIRDYSYQFTSENPLSWKQLTNSSRPCIYMRGGGKYRVFSNNPITWSVVTQATTYSQQMVQPMDSCPAITARRATVYTNINGTASSANNASALGGSSLSQILAQAGSGNAFTGLDTATNNVIKLTRANGGTIQKIINNVSNATSASIASTSNVSKKVGNSTVGSTSIPVYIKEGTPTSVTSIPSSFAATSVNINDKNLNDIRTPGEYYAGGGNSCSNKPASVDAFALEVRRAADGWYVQIMYASNNQNKTYIRYYNGSAWTAWTAQSTSGGNNAYNSVSVSNATLKFGRLNGATGTTVTINNVANATSAANANLLDGIDSSRFIYGSGAHGVNSSFSNASSIWKSGFYDLSTTGGSASGLPTTNSWHWLIHAGHRSNTTTYRYGLQIAAPNNTSGNLYYRINPQSGNGTWHTLLDEHNLATYTTKFVTKDELGSGSTTGTINVDAARRIVNSTVNTRNAQSFRVGTPGSGSWTGFPSSYLYSTSSTAALKTNAYYRKQVGVLHVAAGTAYHDLVFADAGTDNGIVRVSSKGDTGIMIDTTNYATYSTRYNALSSSTLTVTTAGGVNIDGGSY